MKDFVRLFASLLLIITISSSCHEDLVEEVVITDEFTPFTIFEAQVNGIVSDDSGDPIANATILIDGEMVQTDDLGYFQIENLRSNSQESKQLSIQAEGFLPSSRLIRVLSPSTIDLNISLIPIPGQMDFQATDGFTAQVSESASIQFFPNGITRDNQPYTGQVFLRSYHLAKDDEQLFDKLPGALVGLDVDETLQQLETYGMIYALLEDEFGNELQPDPGATALLTINIPDQYLNVAPAEVPLWFFDETSGVWIEEGIATKNGNRYEGNVTHFSWWNIDIPIGNLLTICMNFIDDATGEPLSNSPILFSSEGIQFGIQFTNDDGSLCVNLPDEFEIDLRVEADCAYTNSVTIGPFTNSQDNIDVALGVNRDGAIAITGTVIDCEGNPLDIENISVSRDGNRQVIPVNSDGSYAYELLCPRSGDRIKILAFDPQTNIAAADELIIQNADENVVFDFNTCDQADNLLSGEIFGEATAISIESVRTNPNETILVLDNGCFLSFLGNTTGTFDGAYFCGTSESGEVVVTITQYNNIVSGSFSGTDLSGTFSASIN